MCEGNGITEPQNDKSERVSVYEGLTFLRDDQREFLHYGCQKLGHGLYVLGADSLETDTLTYILQ